MTPNTKALVVEDPAKIALIGEALKAYKIPQTLTSAYAKEGTIPMGGTMPPAVTVNKPVSAVTDNLGLDYPPKGDVTMQATQKQLGGEKLPIPEANTVPSNIKSEEIKAGSKPDTKPSGVHDTFPTAVGSDASVDTTMMGSPRSSLTPGTGDKGTFTPTDDPNGGSGADLPGKPFKAWNSVFTYIKAFGKFNNGVYKARAKMMLDEAFDAMQNGQSARTVLEEVLAKIEEALSGAPAGAPGMGPGAGAPAPMPAPAGPAGPQSLGTEEAGMPAPAAAQQAPSMPPAAPGASPMPGMAEEDLEAYKALKTLGERLSKGEITFKQYDDAISSVFQPKGGSDNFTNLRTPGQPPGKVAASPGRSGSSEVFRTDTGSKGGVGMTRDSQVNPAATLETAQDAPIGTYETDTTITSGPGYQMDILRGLSDGDIRKRGMPHGSTNLHPSLVKFFNLKTNEARALGEHASKEAVETIPRGMEEGSLKFISSTRPPTKEELTDLAKKGLLDERLLQKATIETEDPKSKGQTEGVLMKGLRRIVDSA